MAERFDTPAVEDGWISYHMETALRRLQTVESFDFAGAADACYPDLTRLDPRTSRSDAEAIYGRFLAYRLFTRSMRNVVALRGEHPWQHS